MSSLHEIAKLGTVDYLKKIDDSFWFSDFTIKGQGQSADLWNNVVRSIFLEPFGWKMLGTVNALKCLGQMVKGQGQTTGLCRNVRWISLDLFVCKMPKMVPWI